MLRTYHDYIFQKSKYPIITSRGNLTKIKPKTISSLISFFYHQIHLLFIYTIVTSTIVETMAAGRRRLACKPEVAGSTPVSNFLIFLILANIPVRQKQGQYAPFWIKKRLISLLNMKNLHNWMHWCVVVRFRVQNYAWDLIGLVHVSLSMIWYFNIFSRF